LAHLVGGGGGIGVDGLRSRYRLLNRYCLDRAASAACESIYEAWEWVWVADRPVGSETHRYALIEQAEVLAGLAEIVNDETGIATESVQLEKSFTDDLDIDSISMMTIVVNAEDKFGVKIPDEEVKNLITVGDAVNFIVSAQG